MRAIHRHVRIFWAVIVLLLAVGQVMHACEILEHGGVAAEQACTAETGACSDNLCCHPHDGAVPLLAVLPPVSFSSRQFVLQDETLAEGLPLEIEHPPQLS